MNKLALILASLSLAACATTAKPVQQEEPKAEEMVIECKAVSKGGYDLSGYFSRDMNLLDAVNITILKCNEATGDFCIVLGCKEIPHSAVPTPEPKKELKLKEGDVRS